ncbi:MAG: transposase [Burkholderiales bacterium RIFCSPLOWO2_12_FULL_67_210]|nr:MAG: transposase [Burkholderiales bacterium RIFCSPLOWO2_12_FULL_67_210]
MIRLATIIDTFEADFLTQYRGQLRSEHYRALAAMKQCRTQASPMMRVKCTGCEQQKLVPHSCGHRHCPHCQHHESQQWLERQMKKQVPAEYFLLTFTLPAEFRALSWAHQSVVYELLMRCSWETVRTFSKNDRQLQGTPGAIAVLHTNTRQLEFHPHVHLVMPAAAVDAKQRQWRTKRAGYLFNQKALAKVFRAKMLAGLEAAGLTPPQRYPKKWVVDCKSVGSGEKALIYLGRYLYRGVIAEKDIVACDNGKVSFRYRDAKTAKVEQRTVSGAHFLWLVLQHVLPKGFRRARNFGFLHPNCKRVIALLHVLLKFVPAQTSTWFKQRAPILCVCCGAVMTIMKTRIRSVFTGGVPAPIVTQGAH